MRHYFCLDEERVIYLGVKEHLCGIGGERKRTVVWTERPFDGKLERPIHDLIREWGLKGKRVDLVLEAGPEKKRRRIWRQRLNCFGEKTECRWGRCIIPNGNFWKN